MKSLILAAGLCIVVVNVWVLGKVAINQWVGEEKVLHLTERELVMRKNDINNSVRSLSLVWQGNQPSDYLGLRYGGTKVQLDASSYQRLAGDKPFCGADFDRRQGWVLLEYDGRAFAKLLEQYKNRVVKLERQLDVSDDVDDSDEARLKQARKNLLSQQRGGSRLVVVDVARERGELTIQGEKLGRPFLILPVTYYPVHKCKSTELMLVAKDHKNYYLAQRYASGLGVSYQTRRYGEAWKKPRYQIELAFGSLNIPWVASLSLCQNGCELAK